MSARDEIVARIRAANTGARTPAPHLPAYRQATPDYRATIIARFVERLADYNVTVLRAREDVEVRAVAAMQLAARGIASLVIPPDLPMSWRPQTPEPILDTNLSYAELDAAHGAMTGSLLAIAESGTVVLDCGHGQGRRALSLLPDYHLCVVREGAVVGILPEAMDTLRFRVTHFGAPLTFCSGPSATADIELDRVEGVHGPRTLDIVLVA